MQFFIQTIIQTVIQTVIQLIQILAKQFKWIAGLIMLILAAHGMRDRDLPELAAQAQPVGMPLVWARRTVTVLLALGTVIFLGLSCQSLADRILQAMNSLPGKP